MILAQPERIAELERAGHVFETRAASQASEHMISAQVYTHEVVELEFRVCIRCGLIAEMDNEFHSMTCDERQVALVQEK